MAQRIVIPVLGTTMAPYGSHAPTLQTGNVSENQHYDVTQLGRGVDTTAAVRAQYPFALAYVNAYNPSTLVANISKARRLYIAINSAALDSLAS